jgi:glucose dehydrogenase
MRIVSAPSRRSAFAAVLAGILFAPAVPAQVRYEDLLKGPGENWLTYGGDYESQRYSPLDQITTANVQNLVSKWT